MITEYTNKEDEGAIIPVLPRLKSLNIITAEVNRNNDDKPTTDLHTIRSENSGITFKSFPLPNDVKILNLKKHISMPTF